MKNIDLDIPEDFMTPQQMARENRLVTTIQEQNDASLLMAIALWVMGGLIYGTGQAEPNSELLMALRSIVSFAWIFLAYLLFRITWRGWTIRQIFSLKDPFTVVPEGDLRSMLESRANTKLILGGLVLAFLGLVTSGGDAVVDNRSIYDGWVMVTLLYAIFLASTGFACRRQLQKQPAYLE